MGFRDTLDSIREKLQANPDEDGYYDDDVDQGMDEPWYDDGDVSTSEPRTRSGRQTRDPYQVETTSGVLGNTSRPEANSVSVYTRSGRPVSADRTASFDSPVGYTPSARVGGGYDGQDDGQRHVMENMAPSMSFEAGPSTDVPTSRSQGYDATPASPTDTGLKAIPRVSSGQLPPYVLKPTSYDDVQMVIRRVRTNQPVVLNFSNTNIDTAKRILDFCFGLSCGIDGNVEELGDRVFAVEPNGVQLSPSDISKLVASGVIKG